jgi:hypothetical protein
MKPTIHIGKIIGILVISFFMTLFFAACDKASDSNQQTGTGGSMARFAIAHDHLYIIDNRNLKVFNIEQPGQPQYIHDVNVGRNIETIYPHKDMLFIGSESGMYAYDISNPENPVFLSQVNHVFSCDPVVVNDSLAFVTLRTGSDCRTGNDVNQLEIIDIKNISNPIVLSVFPMDTPHGLALDDTLLFVCHGDYGLGIYHIVSPLQIHELHRITGIKTYDVIPRNKVLFVIGDDGFYQYSYDNPYAPQLLSYIPVNKVY